LFLQTGGATKHARQFEGLITFETRRQQTGAFQRVCRADLRINFFGRALRVFVHDSTYGDYPSLSEGYTGGWLSLDFNKNTIIDRF
jgi:hypothetical protein